MTKKTRIDGRSPDQLRPVKITRGFTRSAAGSVLIETGGTRVLCTASVEESVPKWREAAGLGWVSAEYEMLPAATNERRKRNRDGKIDGRTQEIQRLIGRCLRAVVDMKKLGPRSIWIDCDVIEADGGTRTAAINGGYIALCDAVAGLRKKGLITASPIMDGVAAVSVGLCDGRVLLDLCYDEDKDAGVDFNVVMTGGGQFVELQGAAEGGTFAETEMRRILATAKKGIGELLRLQTAALKKPLTRRG